MPSRKLKSRRRKRVAPEHVLGDFIFEVAIQAITNPNATITFGNVPPAGPFDREIIMDSAKTIDIPHEDVTHKRIEG